MNRRGFLHAMLAAGAAPAIVKAANIMPIFVRKDVGGLLVPGWPSEVAYTGLLTPAQIVKEALKLLEHNLQFASRLDIDFDHGIAALNALIVRPARWTTPR